MKKIFVSTSLLRKSFFEIDKKTRRSIQVYLWYISLLAPIIFWLEDFLLLSLLSHISLHPIISFLCILLFTINLVALISLWRTTNIFFEWYIKIFIFGIYIQILPFIYIFLGVLDCFEFLMGESSIYVFSSTLDLIVALWALRYTLRLRDYALKK